jgi:hypothetical protein
MGMYSAIKHPVYAPHHLLIYAHSSYCTEAYFIDRDARYIGSLWFIHIRDYVQFENHRFSCVHSMFVNHPVCAPQNLHKNTLVLTVVVVALLTAV